MDAHPNFTLMEPEGQFNYKIDQLRDFIKDTSLAISYQGNRRVYLIPEADKMQPEGANALLKTLEEPGQGTIMILVSSNILKILSTIISRCQQVRFSRLSRKLIEDSLIQKSGIETHIAKLVSNLADGSYVKALNLSDKKVIQVRQKIYSSLSTYPPKDVKNLFQLIEQVTEAEESAKIHILTIYDCLIYWFRDILVYRISKDASQIINQDYQKEISAISSQWNWSALRSSIQRLEYLKFIMQEKPIDPQFTLETVFLRAYQIVS